ncbi:MAG: peptidoglycan bridge formation glycyltransferase FemA/FemB family protein [Chloroflexi bacterium]|nr:peptidoglycan bridge formation glycyltransferase FemA/FemB family protein [Chloroflexota bacterium]
MRNEEGSSAFEWDATLSALPNAHLLQSWQWGEFKSRYGWSARRVLWLAADLTGLNRPVRSDDKPLAAAQILKRTLGPFSILYVPKGPCLDWADADLVSRVLSDLESLARRERAIFIKIDPEVITATGLPGDPAPAPDSRALSDAARAALAAPWFPSPTQIQFKNTVWLDLNRSADDLLASFKQKTRYNIRLAERKGVTVQAPPPADAPLDLLYRLYAETSVRDGFAIRHAGYYRDAWGSFIQSGHAQPFIASVDGDAVAAIIVFRFARRAIYMYGMSRAAHRDKMPNHLLQWTAIQWAKAQGCALYDFWGAPDVFDESDSMFGVWKFKEGFNGAVIRTAGAYDYSPSPLLYRLYTVTLPRLLNLMRRRANRQTRELVG